MSNFTKEIIVALIPGGRKVRLVESFSYYVGKTDYLTDHGIVITVPVGFVSDGASIPRFAWPIIGSPLTGKYRAAAIIHDYCYFMQMFSREISDKIFLEAMKVLKVSKWKRYIIYWAVRLFGCLAWGNRQR